MRIRAARLPPVLDLPSPASWSSLSAACLPVGAGGAALLPPLSANWPSLCSALWTTSTAAVPRRGQNILIRCEIRWVDAHFVDGVPAGSRRRVVFHGTFCKLKKKFFPFGPLKRKPLYFSQSLFSAKFDNVVTSKLDYSADNRSSCSSNSLLKTTK